MKSLRRRRASLLAILAAVVVPACGGGGGGNGPDPPPPPQLTLAAVSVNPSTVVGGASTDVTATLSTAAPAGGATVTLSSNNAAVTVPASIAIASGSTSASASASTSAVTASTATTITGTFGGVTRSANLVVDPSPVPPVVARFAVTSPARGANACQLTQGGAPDCTMDGGASTGIGAIVQWSWRFIVGSTVENTTTTTPTARPSSTCGLFNREPATTRDGQTFIQMRVELVVRDSAGRDSAATVNNDVRVFPQQQCGRGF